MSCPVLGPNSLEIESGRCRARRAGGLGHRACGAIEDQLAMIRFSSVRIRVSGQRGRDVPPRAATACDESSLLAIEQTGRWAITREGECRPHVRHPPSRHLIASCAIPSDASQKVDSARRNCCCTCRYAASHRIRRGTPVIRDILLMSHVPSRFDWSGRSLPPLHGRLLGRASCVCRASKSGRTGLRQDNSRPR